MTWNYSYCCSLFPAVVKYYYSTNFLHLSIIIYFWKHSMESKETEEFEVFNPVINYCNPYALEHFLNFPSKRTLPEHCYLEYHS